MKGFLYFLSGIDGGWSRGGGNFKIYLYKNLVSAAAAIEIACWVAVVFTGGGR